MKKEYASEATSCTLVEHDSSQKGKGRLGKQERMKRRRGATEQAKGFTDIHGNLQIHSV
ncbi:hypothetical protein KUCAC02_007212, partial [Chaenocephalus aceratus]